jgi:hypothetical protein
MARTKTKTAELKPDLVAGMEVIIVREGSTKGQIGTIAEVDHEDSQVRLSQWGWLPFDAVESIATSAQAPQSRNGTVNGEDAKLVFDGGTGAPTGDEPMIKPPLDDLVKALARAQIKRAECAVKKKKANEDFQEADGVFDAIAAEIVEHYGNVEQLRMQFGATESDDEEAAEEERDPVGAGVE